MEIHVLWLPLITTVSLYLLAYMFNGFEGGEPNNEAAFGLKLLTGVVAFISVVIYAVVGLQWLFSSITIVY